MVNARPFFCLALAFLFFVAAPAVAQQMGSIRGVVIDQDFDVPMAGAQVLINETKQKTLTTAQGSYSFDRVPPGKYTLVITKEGYKRQVRADVVVAPGRLTDVDFDMEGEFTDMDEFVVEDVQIGGATEEALLQLRIDSPGLIDSISSELMKLAGAGDAAAAVTLVSGATVQDGFATVRGLPDRYVNAQLNGVRLPTSDEDKRAVKLDQFPSTVIESVRVTKSFTPDQQGDSSGGAVNVVLKGLPDENVFKFSSQISYNTQATGKDDFLTYDSGGVDFWANDSGGRDIQLGNNTGVDSWDGAVGVKRDDAPIDYKFSMTAGGVHDLDHGVRVGGSLSFFYEHDTFFDDNGTDDSLWILDGQTDLTPRFSQGNPNTPGGGGLTGLYDVSKGVETVQWGSLASVGLETELHKLSMLYLYTRTAEDEAILAEDTRGKAYFFGEEYDRFDSTHPGNTAGNRSNAPYNRTETLTYQERTNQSFQVSGRHELPDLALGIERVFRFLAPEVDWVYARSEARLYEPDKRQFGTAFLPEVFNPGFPPFVPPSTTPATHITFKPDATFSLGNLQRTWKDITEDSKQHSINLKLPFEQWDGVEGYLKLGVFDDNLIRDFDQESFSNFDDPGPASFEGDWEQFWSAVFPSEFHPVTGQGAGTSIDIDVDYKGDQRIKAWYWMADVPLTPQFKMIGGYRYERTELSIVNFPGADAVWFPPTAPPVPTILGPGVADVDIVQDDVLPAIGFVFDPTERITFRGSYTETIARQTFKELTPIQQQEFLGGPVFIGNPELKISQVQNYDLRFDYRPYDGGLISISWFKKDVTDPIEYVRRATSITYTTPINFPSGELEGWEFEVRQDLGRFWPQLEGLSFGANATIIDSEVIIGGDDRTLLANFGVPQNTRNMTGAPEHLYNIFLTYESEETGTEVGVFYTVRGDTLNAGGSVSVDAEGAFFIPDVYEEEFDTLNLSVTQSIGENVKVRFQAKNLTNPEIREVYRSDFIGADVLKTSFTKGIDLSLSISAEFTF